MRLWHAKYCTVLYVNNVLYDIIKYSLVEEVRSKNLTERTPVCHPGQNVDVCVVYGLALFARPHQSSDISRLIAMEPSTIEVMSIQQFRMMSEDEESPRKILK